MARLPETNGAGACADFDYSRRRRLWPAPAIASPWKGRYLQAVSITDVVVVISAVLTAQWIRFGAVAGDGFGAHNGRRVVLVSALLVISWLVALRGYQTLDRRILGGGATEYSRVLAACFTLFGALAIVVMVFQVAISRGYFALALPLGTVGLLLSRWAWRRKLFADRRRGRKLERVLVVGDAGATKNLVDRVRQNPELGFDVIGVCLPVGVAPASNVLALTNDRVRVYGDFGDVSSAVAASGATTVAVMSAEALGYEEMKDLSWSLQGMEVDMMVAPGITDVAGPRMMVRPVAGLPLLHIDKPQYEGANRLRKAVLDRVGAALILLLCTPVLLLVAAVIKLDSRGPVFYRSTRVGLNNEIFPMWKFRTMVPDADAIRERLQARDVGAGILFKIRDDPRVTRAGKVLRRYSIDELPQLLNVLGGSMSLVGPRPPLPDEVAQYDGRMARRMLVKPGMTGLWQIYGRSDLSWEDSVRLDLSYVENWSIMQDMVILWRTFRAVVSKDGAY